MTRARPAKAALQLRPLGNRNAGRHKRRETSKPAAMRERKISASGLHALGLVPVHTSYHRTPWSSKPLHATSMFAVIAQCHTPSFANPHSGSQISPGEGKGEGERQYDQERKDTGSRSGEGARERTRERRREKCEAA